MEDVHFVAVGRLKSRVDLLSPELDGCMGERQWVRFELDGNKGVRTDLFSEKVGDGR